jgi:hypothetical protein
LSRAVEGITANPLRIIFCANWLGEIQVVIFSLNHGSGEFADGSSPQKNTPAKNNHRRSLAFGKSS